MQFSVLFREVPQMNIRFDGRTVAVTGGGHGFGRCIAQTFAHLGAHVFATDIAADELAATAAEGGITTKVADLRDRSAGTSWIRQIETQTGGPIHVLVNNAGGVGGQEPQALEEVSDEAWDLLFEINVNAAFTLCRAVAPAMKRAGGGRIVNISSGAGLQPSLTGIQAYCAAKHAVVGLTRQLAHEFGPYNITVNSVAPGFVRSNPASEKQWEGYGPAGQKTLLERIAMKRLGTAQDIANAVVFFASDLAGFVNGQILQVDGGR
jgi:3-oxoacyl-[acyl-carrier protein] reductase